MRVTANSWSVNRAPKFSQRCGIAAVAFAVSGVASGSVVSSFVDTAANRSEVTFAVAPLVVALDETNSTERERAPPPVAPTSPTRVPVLAPVSAPAETARSEIAAISPPAEAAPSNVQESEVRSRHDLRKGDHERRSRGVRPQIGKQFWQQSNRISELSRGSISSER